MCQYTNNIIEDIRLAPPYVINKRIDRLSANQRTPPELEMERILHERSISFEKEFIILSICNQQSTYQYLDFFIPSVAIAIEIDGAQHYDFENVHQKKLDEQKEHWCMHYGIRLISIRSHLPVDNVMSFNRTEMIKWASLIADPTTKFNRMQYGTGFGQAVPDYFI